MTCSDSECWFWHEIFLKSMLNIENSFATFNTVWMKLYDPFTMLKQTLYCSFLLKMKAKKFNNRWGCKACYWYPDLTLVDFLAFIYGFKNKGVIHVTLRRNCTEVEWSCLSGHSCLRQLTMTLTVPGRTLRKCFKSIFSQITQKCYRTHSYIWSLSVIFSQA